MEIIDKKTAASLGLTKFFTGLPCKNGHLSDRYVSTGACLACLRLPDVVARRNERQKVYNEKNKDAIRVWRKKHQEENRDAILERKRLYTSQNKEKIAACNRAYREKNTEKIREYDKARKVTPEARAARIAAYRRFADEFVGPKRPRRKHTDESLKAKRSAYNATYHSKNKEALAEKSKIYRERHKDVIRARIRSWSSQNQHRRTALQQKRKARKLQAVPCWHGEFDDLVWMEAADLVRLRRTSTGVEWASDHMVPLLSRAACGLHVWNNCQVIPWELNQSKNNRLALTEPLEWLKYI